MPGEGLGQVSRLDQAAMVGKGGHDRLEQLQGGRGREFERQAGRAMARDQEQTAPQPSQEPDAQSACPADLLPAVEAGCHSGPRSPDEPGRGQGIPAAPKLKQPGQLAGRLKLRRQTPEQR
ncbi:MAG: hypothetical protein RLZZ440_1571 [Planctomycetota bacterium]